MAGQESAYIRADAETRFGSICIEADIFENRREIRVNGSRIAKNADLLGNINGVFFSPSELRLVQDGPDERRRFLNVSISQMSKSYYTALVRYNKILEQRNALLKNRDVSLIFETLPVWDVQLCRYAAELAMRRAEYIAMLAPFAKEKHAFLTDGAETLEISSDKHYGDDKEEIEKRLLAEFEANYEKDVKLGFTTAGPHRDDLKILINGTEARVYGSQGQARTAARRRDERARSCPPPQAARRNRGDPDHPHLHAHRKGAVRQSSEQNPHRRRKDKAIGELYGGNQA